MVGLGTLMAWGCDVGAWRMTAGGRLATGWNSAVPVIQVLCESGSNFIWTSSSSPSSTSSHLLPSTRLARRGLTHVLCPPEEFVILSSSHHLTWEKHLVECDSSFCGNMVCFKRRVPCE